VYRVVPHGDPEPILTGMAEPEAMCEGPDKTIWMVFADQVIGWRGDIVGRLPKPSPADEGIYDCAFDEEGRFWASAADNGLYLRHQEGWQAVPGTSGAGLRHSAMAQDKLNNVWVFSGRTALRPLESQVGSRVDLAAAGVDQVGSLSASTRGLLVSAESGLGELRFGKFAFAKGKQVSAFLGATGLIETPQGEIWAMSSRGLVRTSRAELERAFADPNHVVNARTFDRLDGLSSRYRNQSIRALVQGGDGRVWMATAGGTLWIDPARIRSNPVAPPVAVTSVQAGGVRHRDPNSLQLAAGTNELVFDFAVLSHAMPERARVLYRLHGFDDRWIDPGSRRQAFYTNLPPGDYRFQVIAANEDGVWNRQGVEVGVAIPPTFLQSWWFTLLCGLAAVAAFWLLYKARIRQVGRRIHAVLEERLAERERIARELHDTLLQSVQGLILSFQAATEQLHPEDPKRGPLERTLKRADDVLAEGRDRVHLLRTATRSEPLDAAIKRLVGDAELGPGVSSEVIVLGASRAIQPAVEDEICAIAGEALRNIAQHANAKSVQVVLDFGFQNFRFSVKDDGVGLPASVHALGSRAGHFGLTGMRERAAEIGGTCQIESSSGAGTTIILKIPARVAYRSSRRSGVRGVWSRVRPQRAHA
jgi:signal transduction histidine kinase